MLPYSLITISNSLYLKLYLISDITIMQIYLLYKKQLRMVNAIFYSKQIEYIRVVMFEIEIINNKKRTK